MITKTFVFNDVVTFSFQEGIYTFMCNEWRIFLNPDMPNDTPNFHCQYTCQLLQNSLKVYMILSLLIHLGKICQLVGL